MRKITAATALVRLAHKLEADGDTRNADLVTHLSLFVMAHAGSTISDDALADKYVSYQRSVSRQPAPEEIDADNWVPMRDNRPQVGLKPRNKTNPSRLFKDPDEADSFIPLDRITHEIMEQKSASRH